MSKVYVQSWTYKQKSDIFGILEEKILVFILLNFCKTFYLIRFDRYTTEMEAGAFQRSR